MIRKLQAIGIKIPFTIISNDIIAQVSRPNKQNSGIKGQHVLDPYPTHVI